jgi:hypothetical protein
LFKGEVMIMKRLGKYSGRIYEENEVHTMKECGVCITDEEAKDEEWVSKHHVNDLMDCITCLGCPLAQK